MFDLSMNVYLLSYIYLRNHFKLWTKGIYIIDSCLAFFTNYDESLFLF